MINEILGLQLLVGYMTIAFMIFAFYSLYLAHKLQSAERYMFIEMTKEQLENYKEFKKVF